MISPILIIDDEENILQTLGVMFKCDGIETVTETNPLRAIERFKKNNFDVVLTDIVMPEMRGVEVIRQVKEINPLCNVIIMTAFSTMTYVVECIEAGAVDYVTKPFVEMELLIGIVREARRRVERWRNSFGLVIPGIPKTSA